MDNKRKELSLMAIEETDLLERVSVIRKKRQSIKLNLCEEEYGIHVDSVVIYRGKEHKVCEVIVQAFDDKPWLRGYPKKNDGVFGKSKRNLFNDWELV